MDNTTHTLNYLISVEPTREEVVGRKETGGTS